MIRALVMTHGKIGTELVRVVEMILGPVEGLAAGTNAGKSAADLQEEITAWLDEADSDDGEIILIDDYGGSCANAAILACGESPRRAVLSGVNLAMLLGYVTWRDDADHAELAQRLVQKGRDAITVVGGR